MKIEIIKVDSGKYCMHESCKKDSKYVTPKSRIRKGTIAAKITHKFKTSSRYKNEVHFYYCRTCIDQLLHDCRVHLDHKLWIFS